MIDYTKLYNLVVEYDDTVDLMPLGGDHIGEDGNPYGFTKLEDAIKYRDAFVQVAREKSWTDVRRAYVIVGDRVPV